MNRIWKFAGIGLITVLVVIQFFKPERNSAPVYPEKDMLVVITPPEKIADILRNACYDCHSDQTHYPWYDKIQPVSWFLNGHIKKGKAELNFSEYGDLEKEGRIKILVDICEVLEAGSMPLRSYRSVHKDARLTPDDREALCLWTEEEALKVMRE